MEKRVETLFIQRKYWAALSQSTEYLRTAPSSLLAYSASEVVSVTPELTVVLNEVCRDVDRVAAVLLQCAFELGVAPPPAIESTPTPGNWGAGKAQEAAAGVECFRMYLQRVTPLSFVLVCIAFASPKQPLVDIY